MTRINFSKTMLRTLGVILLLLSSMSLYSSIEYGVQLAILGYLLAAILLLLSAALGMDKNAFLSKAKRIGRALAVIGTTIVLHGLGVVVMSNVHWIAGMALILLGLANLLFLTPAIKGFEENQ